MIGVAVGMPRFRGTPRTDPGLWGVYFYGESVVGFPVVSVFEG
jgi:hypothetical protein